MNHIAAIHVIKAQLRLTVEDYRALLQQLTGKDSSKGMTDAELLRVRAHMSGLANKMGVTRATAANATATDNRLDNRVSVGRRGAFKVASPKERKVWAMWHDLGAKGKLDNPSGSALNAWVKRQTGVDQMRFCNDAQMNGLIESLKLWAGRENMEVGR